MFALAPYRYRTRQSTVNLPCEQNLLRFGAPTAEPASARTLCKAVAQPPQRPPQRPPRAADRDQHPDHGRPPSTTAAAACAKTVPLMMLFRIVHIPRDSHANLFPTQVSIVP